MILSTVGVDHKPSSRTVLLKGIDGRGFVFFSNYNSNKGRDLENNPSASLLFPWIGLERQVIVGGNITKVAKEESEAYFHSRPILSQLAAWTSHQSAIVSGRDVIEQNMKSTEIKYAGQQVPLPPHWGGYRLAPEYVEFWQGRRNRLHDRLRYRKTTDGWIVERLSP
jgi:pyridoxamine 5'-phosphate oxidase